MERTQPILPLCENIPERQSHDYYRHGTTTLFAALVVATGKKSGSCEKHHTRKEFLKKLDKETDHTKVLHVIVDNYATHKTKEVLEKELWILYATGTKPAKSMFGLKVLHRNEAKKRYGLNRRIITSAKRTAVMASLEEKLKINYELSGCSP